MDTNESAEVGGGENTIGGAFGLVFDSELSLDHCTIYGNNSISGGVSGFTILVILLLIYRVLFSGIILVSGMVSQGN